MSPGDERPASDPDDEIRELPAPTIFPECGLTILSWDTADEDEARRFGRDVLDFAAELSRHLDLSRLAGFVIGMDYRAALASVDQRYGDYAPTSNEFAEGCAMAATIMRDGEPWSKVVIWMPVVRQLVEREHPAHPLAVYVVAHELTHVHDLRVFSKTFPGGWQAAKPRNARESALQHLVNLCQTEYTACRRTAPLLPEHGLTYLDTLEAVMKRLTDVQGDLRSFDHHRDLGMLWNAVRGRVTFLFQALGYALGHADWAVLEEGADPELRARYESRIAGLRGMPFGWLIDEAAHATRPFYGIQEWTGLEMYADLEAVGDKLLKQFGVYLSDRNGHLWLDLA